MDDRRSAARNVSKDFGMITLPSGAGFPCRIEDRSETGLQIAVHSTLPIPDAFEVQLLASGERMRVRVAWRRLSALGVKVADRVAA